jgi:hypothetical protein
MERLGSDPVLPVLDSKPNLSGVLEELAAQIQ